MHLYSIFLSWWTMRLYTEWTWLMNYERLVLSPWEQRGLIICLLDHDDDVCFLNYGVSTEMNINCQEVIWMDVDLARCIFLRIRGTQDSSGKGKCKRQYPCGATVIAVLEERGHKRSRPFLNVLSNQMLIVHNGVLVRSCGFMAMRFWSDHQGHILAPDLTKIRSNVNIWMDHTSLSHPIYITSALDVLN